MAEKLKFLLGIHCHQPVGNFGHVFEHGHDVSYRPFLETLEQFPGIRVSAHYSGPLLEWLSEKKPGFFSLLRSLVERGQVELTGGGHYEPILPVIPRRDAVGQIRFMRSYLRREFGVRVRGAWLTERIWEPSLPSLLAEAGVEFTTVDDFHFLSAGFDTEKLHDYYLSEDEGRCVAVFPISQRLRYLVPFHPVEEVIEYFREKHRELPSGSAVVLYDDGEKFGMWPGTHDWVFGQKWLEKFFAAVEAESDWLEMSSFGEVLDSAPAAGRVYLPTSSYFEMGGWSLPPDAGEEFQKLEAELDSSGAMERFWPFLRGSFWRNFLVKYPESNWMHKRMFHTSRRVHTGLGPRAGSPSRPPAVLRRLWMAQCNCAYWHGIFGGLYLPHLRRAIFRCLIEAEKRLPGGDGLELEACDIDMDSRPEIRLANSRIAAYISPEDGGCIAELDDFATAQNIIDTLARRKEAYHYRMMLGEGEQPGDSGEDGHQSIHERSFTDKLPPGEFIYDPAPLRMLREHFFAGRPEDFSPFERNEIEDFGDFARGPWQWRRIRRKGSLAGADLRREGHVRLPGGEPVPVLMTKRVLLRTGSSSLEVSLEIVNNGQRTIECMLGVSLCFIIFGHSLPEARIEVPTDSAYALDSGHMLPGAKQYTVPPVTDNPGLAFRFSRAAECAACYPVETISQSESGIERTYQGTRLLPLWPLGLAPGARRRLEIEISVVN